MEIKSRSEITFYKAIFITIILLFSLQVVTCQNCGVPRVVKILEDTSLTEIMGTGELIASIPLENVKQISSILENPDYFAQILFDKETTTLTLMVGTPLWKAGQSYTSYIDRSREPSLNLVVTFECSDGHMKTVTFEVPIADENTVVPRFHIPDSNLVTEPCVAERCTLTLSTEVIIIDEDRDQKNAEVMVWTNSAFVKAVPSFTSIRPWYDSPENAPSAYSTPNGYQSVAKLEFLAELKGNATNPYNVTIYASNVADHYNKTKVTITKDITLNFVELDGRMVSPIFSSPFYYSHVMRYKRISDVNPSNIRAQVPDNISNHTVIYYSIDGSDKQNNECAFKIDHQTGLLSFNDYLRADTLRDLRNSFQTCYIMAERVNMRTEEYKTSHATLITFFTEDFDQPYSQPTSTVKPTSKLEDFTTTGNPVPKECTCGCDEDAFSCSNPSTYPSSNATEYRIFPDQYQCTNYHKCASYNDKSTLKCPEGTIFCPDSMISNCTSLEECLATTSMPCLPKDHDNYGACETIQPRDPRNVCNTYNYSHHAIEDPDYCDIYHMCQPRGYMNEFYDFPKLCPVGQIFCPKVGVCGNHEHVDCDCPAGKSLKQCNVCIMGQWRNFNLFSKKFENII